MNKAIHLVPRSGRAFPPRSTREGGPMSLRRVSLMLFAVVSLASQPVWSQDWPQWGRTPQHTGVVNVQGQRAAKLLDDVVYDPFAEAIETDPEGPGVLTVHYQVPLTDGDDVYMEFNPPVALEDPYDLRKA